MLPVIGFQSRAAGAKSFLFLLASAAGLLLLALTPNGGLRVTPDSAQYLAASGSLLQGEGFRRFEGSLYVKWPPLYSAILGGASVIGDHLGLDTIESARLLHALGFGAVIFAFGLFLLEAVNRYWLVGLALAGMMLSEAMINMGVFLLSELLFTLLIALFLLFLVRFLRQGQQKWFWLCCLFAMLAPLQRYIGMALIPVGAICMVLLLKDSPRKRAGMAGAFVVIASAPLVVWIARNYGLTGTTFGARSDPQYTPVEALILIAEAIHRFFLPLNDNPVTAGARISLPIALVALLAIAIRYRSRLSARKPDPAFLAAGILLFFYVAMLIYAVAIASSSDPLDMRLRYLMPIYPPVIAIAVLALNALLRPAIANRFWDRARTALVGIVLLSWITGVTFTKAFAPVDVFSTHTFSEALRFHCCEYQAWSRLATIRYLEEHKPDGRLYSNSTIPLYFGHSVSEMPRELAQWSQIAPRDAPVFIIWIDKTDYPNYCPRCHRQDYTREALLAALPVRALFEAGNGGVYQLGPGALIGAARKESPPAP